MQEGSQHAGDAATPATQNVAVPANEGDHVEQEPPPHPPVFSRMMPQRDARNKRKAKAQEVRERSRSPASSDIDGDPLSSPCPPPGISSHLSKRKRVAHDVGLDRSRQGISTIVQGVSHAAQVTSDTAPQTVPRETYRWMTRQTTPGPSSSSRHEDGQLPYDLRRDSPFVGDHPSITGFLDATKPPFTQIPPSSAPAYAHPYSHDQRAGATTYDTQPRTNNPTHAKEGPPASLHPSNLFDTTRDKAGTVPTGYPEGEGRPHAPGRYEPGGPGSWNVSTAP